MRIGVATKDDLLDDVELLARAGFDYVELSMMAIAKLTDTEFGELRRRYADAPLKAEAYQSMLPGDIKLVGPLMSDSALITYLAKALDRIAALDGKLAVLGSAGARKCPDGFPRKPAGEQLAVSVGRMADMMNERGMCLGIEQIAPFETNMINTLDEAESLVSALNRPNVGLVVDLAHMSLAGIDPEAISRLGQPVLHAHIAKPKGRLAPIAGDGQDALYERFLRSLRAIGYNGRLSIETGSNTGVPRERILAAGTRMKALVA